MRLSLTDAFARFGARPRNSQRSASAIAQDGAVVLNCAPAFFVRPARGVLRYEDRLTRDSAYPLGTSLLSEHLTLARAGDLPVRLVIAHAESRHGRTAAVSRQAGSDCQVTEFDGDHFIVDFTRLPVPQS
jgi:hypothetical protein